MKLLGNHIQLNPQPASSTKPVLETALLGHCPGRVRVERLQQLPATVDAIIDAGFGERLEQAIAQNNVDHLPIPLQSFAEFEDIFPDTKVKIKSRYQSWLSSSVADFFANGGRSCWVIKIPENEKQQGFLPDPFMVMHEPETLNGLGVVLALNNVGIVAMPDLERLQLPPENPGPDRLHLQNPDPTFLPCSTNTDDDHRERRNAEEMMAGDSPMAFENFFPKLVEAIAQYRPDIQLLFSLPLTKAQEHNYLELDSATMDWLQARRIESKGQRLRHVQFLFPYQQDSEFSLHSSVGLIAGIQSWSSHQYGPWRSTAGVHLKTSSVLFPRLTQQQVMQYRDEFGVGVLTQNRYVSLDDEQLMVPALHPGDFAQGNTQSKVWKDFSSGENARFMGYLIRQLKSLGDSLIFNIDPRSKVPLIVLEKFFGQLFDQGALRGNSLSDALVLQQSPMENGIAIDIQLAPALPINFISLTFINRDGFWQPELGHV